MLSIIDHFGGTDVFRELRTGALVFVAGMNVDADGSPHAYHPDSKEGLDRLSDAGGPGDWYGVVTDAHGVPVVQKQGDPAPGFFVSCTALAKRPELPETNPLRYYNAEEDAYISVPERLKHLLGAKAMVTNLANGLSEPAIVAEIGNDSFIGEGAIILAKRLGINADCRVGGVPGGILYTIFPKH